MKTSIDGKQIVNTVYHATVETLLAVGYSEIGKKVLKKPVPKVDFNIGDITMLTTDNLLGMTTKNFLQILLLLLLLH